MASKTALEKLRESERELTAQLRTLRSKIRIAERGENKRLRNVDKYIARSMKQIERTTKEQEKLREKELEKLEKFLGESFESLGEARLGLKKQTRKATKREKLAEALRLRAKGTERGEREARRYEREAGAARLDPKRTKYSIRRLSELENQEVLDFLSDRKTFANIGLGYLQPSERITVSVPYRYYGADGREHTGYGIGRKVFRDWNDLQRYINTQYITQETVRHQDWIGKIEVIKFPEEYEYAREKGRQTDVKNARHKAVKKMLSERMKKVKQKARASAERKLATERAKVKELKRQLKGRK